LYMELWETVMSAHNFENPQIISQMNRCAMRAIKKS
jgi:hypothetical protein